MTNNLFNSKFFDNKISQKVDKFFKWLFIFICIISIIFGFCLIYFYRDLITLPVVIVILGFITFALTFIYILYRSSQNNSKEDIEREKSVMSEVLSIKQNRILKTKTTLGSWYLGAFIFTVVFPLFAKIVGIMAASPELEMKIILNSGMAIIILFIVGITLTSSRHSDKL